MMKTIATVGSLLLLFGIIIGKVPAATVDADSVTEYIESCRKRNGAFGPSDQAYTDAAWNYPAVHTLRLLGAKIDRADDILLHGLAYPEGHAGVGHWLYFHQEMIRPLLFTDGVVVELVSPSGEKVEKKGAKLEHQGFAIQYYGSPLGTKAELLFQTEGARADEATGVARTIYFYNIASLYYSVYALAAAHRPIANPETAIEYLLARQAPNGGFVDVRTADGKPTDAETHLAVTFQAVACLKLLGAKISRPAEIAKFVQSCQQLESRTIHHQTIGSGGFGFHPAQTRAGNIADVYYTCCALQILTLIDAKPIDAAACTSWINSLQNHDGGFGDRPGWRSRLYSTYYAVQGLSCLAEIQQPSRQPAEKITPWTEVCGLHRAKLAAALIMRKERESPRIEPIPEGKYQIYQGLFKTPVVAADDLAGLQKRGLNLIGMKTEDFAAAEPLAAKTKADKLSLTAILCPEAYPHRLRQAGGAVLNHVGNFTLDPQWSAEEREIWNAANAAGKEGLSWDGYREQVLQPLTKLGSLCYPEQDFEQEYAYAAYDAGVYQQGGYNAVQVGFNWVPRDFVRVFPWRERYVDKLPQVADCDSHGDLAKWSPQLDYVRHLYLAEKPDYASFQEAARHGRVVCVIVPAHAAGEVANYGPSAVVDYVRRRVAEWKWWKD